MQQPDVGQFLVPGVNAPGSGDARAERIAGGGSGTALTDRVASKETPQGGAPVGAPVRGSSVARPPITPSNPGINLAQYLEKQKAQEGGYQVGIPTPVGAPIQYDGGGQHIPNQIPPEYFKNIFSQLLRLRG